MGEEDFIDNENFIVSEVLIAHPIGQAISQISGNCHRKIANRILIFEKQVKIKHMIRCDFKP